ncbi:hypothetical protein NLX83_38105 [Allokutzneria sp. A3M-2-11 16]|uniref:hypothetical protein n=1 Tax=Allokutzneria sp. A3M-2-11 16 TaxID=2962043 RepID=UPI0020B81A4D|nr:hypothetical protein [Allokutzneria sp. A3M-2-11 16]MCP3805095.1 hypothetical protein [Allokutzneria sp. A3M-2-11 16]
MTETNQPSTVDALYDSPGQQSRTFNDFLMPSSARGSRSRKTSLACAVPTNHSPNATSRMATNVSR